MFTRQKLFKVKKYVEPEWGSTRTEFVKYFVAASEDTVRSVVSERYGKSHYDRYEREEVKYDIEEVDVEVL